MKYVSFNHTDLKVSALCLGTAEYGAGISKESADRQLSQFYENGGNFIDTAHVYGDWVPGEKARSERVIGKWLSENGLRNHVIISTKGGHPELSDMKASRLRREDLEEDLNGSLRSLNTDYIDLYFLHRDDRNIPVCELIDYLEEKRAEGKLRYYGCSNWALDRLRAANEYAEKKKYSGFVCNQILDSLAKVNAEIPAKDGMIALDQEYSAYHKHENLNLMAYMSMSGGYFKKRYNHVPLSQKAESLYKNEANDRIFAKLKELVNEGYSITQLALHYVWAREYPSVPIVSFSRESQLMEALESCETDIPAGVMEELVRGRER